jgi:type VI protein secretion system component VasA
MMDNPEVLRGTLALYDWTDDEMNRRRLEAIVAVKHTLIRRFEKGFMLRGVEIEVTLNGQLCRRGRCESLWRNAASLLRALCRYSPL